jgi:hypothetical protein
LVAPRPRVHRSISADGLRELQSFLDDLAKWGSYWFLFFPFFF